jgi:hypothetical protein
LITQINPKHFYWAIKTSPKAPLPNFYNISKFYNLISLALFIDIFYLRDKKGSFLELKAYLDIRFLVPDISTGAESNSFFFLN